MKRKPKPKRLSQEKMWRAAMLYRKEAERCHKAKAYFFAIVGRACQLEALLRIFDFVQTRRPKDRCRDFYSLVNTAFKKHWIPHDALRYWKKHQKTPLKTVLHEIREARNGVHAHLFDRGFVTRRTSGNVTYVVQTIVECLEIKNARNLMKHLHRRGELSTAEYNAWKKRAS